MEFKQFFSKFTIYQYVTTFLLVLILTTSLIPKYGFGWISLIPVLISVLTASILDALIYYYKTKTREFPQSGFISGLFIGGLLTQNLSWYIYVIAGAVAILSKHLIKLHGRHIFNPANIGILVVSLVFSNAFNSWWIASPKILVLVFGVFIVWRMRRLDLAIMFLLTYFVITSAIDFWNSEPLLDIYYGILESSIIVFFATFMLIEPKTHPAGKKQRIIYGILVALMLIGIERNNPILGIPFVLAVANLFIPFLNRVRFDFFKKKAEDQRV